MQQLLSKRISQDANYVIPPNCVINVHTVEGMREGRAVVKNNGYAVAILNYVHDRFDGECKFFENGDIHQRIFYRNGIINGWCSQYVSGEAVKYELYNMGTCLKIIVKVDNTESQWLVINPETNEIVKIKDLKNGNMVETTADGKIRLYDGKYNMQQDQHFRGFVREGSGIGYDGDLMYNGEWKNGRLEIVPGTIIDYTLGEPILTDNNGTIFYIGFIKNGTAHGNGKVIKNGNVVCEGKWDDGTLSINEDINIVIEDGYVYVDEKRRGGLFNRSNNRISE